MTSRSLDKTTQQQLPPYSYINLQNLLLFSKEIFKNKRKKIKNIFKSDLMDKKFKKLIDKRAEDLKTNELLYLFNEF